MVAEPNKHTALPWFKFYANNFLVRTATLGAEGRGAFIALLAHYWDAGGALPNNPNFLRKICDLTKYKWEKLSPSLLTYFRIEDDRLYHEEMEQLLQEARHNRQNKIKAGQASGRARNRPPQESDKKETNTRSEQSSSISSFISSSNNCVTNNSDIEKENRTVSKSISAAAYRLAETFRDEAMAAWPDREIPDLEEWVKGMEKILLDQDEQLRDYEDQLRYPDDIGLSESRVEAVIAFYFEEYIEKHRALTSPAILIEDFDGLDLAYAFWRDF